MARGHAAADVRGHAHFRRQRAGNARGLALQPFFPDFRAISDGGAAAVADDGQPKELRFFHQPRENRIAALGVGDHAFAIRLALLVAERVQPDRGGDQGDLIRKKEKRTTQGGKR